jgi:biotin-dependent carboxylase-like uncharacterized protein
MGLIVIDPGFFTTIQDMGRPGYREWGVPVGGAFDRGSAELANALLGNPTGCAVLEWTLSGGIYQAEGPLAIALAGASIEAKIVGPAGTEHPLRLPLSCSLQVGDRLIAGRILEGARTYLAVKGGWLTPLRLGSRSTEERIRLSALLPAAQGTIPTRHLGNTERKPWDDRPMGIVAGPEGRADRGWDEQCWNDRRFQVGSQSDRMGLRLVGEPLSVSSAPERLSTPVAPGAIQVTGGQLIVLGVACGTMGGYPHVAQVISADLDRLGQLRVGDRVSFRLVSLEQARNLDNERRSYCKQLTSRLRLLAIDQGVANTASSSHFSRLSLPESEA